VILEKNGKKKHQIWSSYDVEKRNTTFNSGLKRKSRILYEFFLSPRSWVRVHHHPYFLCVGLFSEDVGPTWCWWHACSWANKRVRLGWWPRLACHTARPGCGLAGGPDQQPAWRSAKWGGAWWTTYVAVMWRPGLACQVYTRNKIMFKKGENRSNTQENLYLNGLYLCKVVRTLWVQFFGPLHFFCFLI
jgi:hypothetical protein